MLSLLLPGYSCVVPHPRLCFCLSVRPPVPPSSLPSPLLACRPATCLLDAQVLITLVMLFQISPELAPILIAVIVGISVRAGERDGAAKMNAWCVCVCVFVCMRACACMSGRERAYGASFILPLSPWKSEVAPQGAPLEGRRRGFGILNTVTVGMIVGASRGIKVP